MKLNNEIMHKLDNTNSDESAHNHCVFCNVEIEQENIGLLASMSPDTPPVVENLNKFVKIACKDCSHKFQSGTDIMKEAMLEQALELRLTRQLKVFSDITNSGIYEDDSLRKQTIKTGIDAVQTTVSTKNIFNILINSRIAVAIKKGELKNVN